MANDFFRYFSILKKCFCKLLYILYIAMSVMGMGPQEQKNVLQLVAAILHLGNISFAEDRSNFAVVQDERCKYIYFFKL